MATKTPLTLNIANQFLSGAVVLAFVIMPGFAAAEPLTATILRESERLARDVANWNEECGKKPLDDEVCTRRRRMISAELAQFVTMANDELDGLRHPSEKTMPILLEQFAGRRRIMELEIRIALHNIKCLGMSDSTCSGEVADIAAERTALRDRYREAHDFFDHGWFPLTVSPLGTVDAKRQK